MAAMSGLLALLDDVAAIAKVAAASVDDIAAAAGKAGSKAAGIIIDDAAVTPKYVAGIPAARELPMIWRIALGSIRNKLVFLLPALMLLNYFFPIAITVLLLMGGAYLCFEGAEKVVHWVMPHQTDAAAAHEAKDPERLEEERVAGAIKTDFILSAEIMTISLAQIPEFPVWMEIIALAVVALAVTAVVYGAVALIVKMDDAGVYIAAHGRLAATRSFGRMLVKGMPVVMTALSIIGTLAMLWVGGSIITHSLHQLGWHLPYEAIESFAAGYSAPGSFLRWLIVAALDGVIGLVLGLLLIPVVEKLLKPLFGSKAH